MLNHITNPTPGPIWHMRAKSDHSIRLKNMYFIAAIVVLFVVIVIIIVGKKNFPLFQASNFSMPWEIWVGADQ